MFALCFICGIINAGGSDCNTMGWICLPAPFPRRKRRQNLGGKNMSCETCKTKPTTPESVPYIVHESAMARAERTVKRLWITILTLILLLVGTNTAWIWYESKFEDVVTTIEAEQGDGVNIVGGGDVSYGAESENND